MAERPPDRTALITGGTGGLGTAVTEVFLSAGWRTVVTSRAPAADGPPSAGKAEVVHADLVEEDDAARAVDVAAGVHSAPLRAVVNLVGGFSPGPRIADTTPEEFEALFRLNVRPTYLVTRAALPRLIEAGGGAVVSVSSRAAVQPFPGASGYVASKAAVIAFSAALAVEYGRDGVRSNVVLPTMIDTPANRADQPGADGSRWTPPDRIAEVIHFLTSAGASSVNGAAIPV